MHDDVTISRCDQTVLSAIKEKFYDESYNKKITTSPKGNFNSYFEFASSNLSLIV